MRSLLLPLPTSLRPQPPAVVHVSVIACIQSGAWLMDGCHACLVPPAGTAAVSHFAELDAVSLVTGVLGAFLAFQANRVRFVFDEEALEVRRLQRRQADLLWRGRRDSAGRLAAAEKVGTSPAVASQPRPGSRPPQVVVGPGAKKSDNAFVGGENRWKYSSFVNWWALWAVRVVRKGYASTVWEEQ